jgi:hypothetical protein
MLRLILFFIYITSASLCAKTSSSSAKQKIAEELAFLQQDLQLADALVRELQQDNLKLQQSFQSLESWGIAQQEEKERYYEELTSFENELSEAKHQVDIEKNKQKDLLAKYHRVRKIFGYICGGLLLFLYLSVGAPIVKNLSVVFGAWSPVALIASPVLAFWAGYLAIYFIF